MAPPRKRSIRTVINQLRNDPAWLGLPAEQAALAARARALPVYVETAVMLLLRPTGEVVKIGLPPSKTARPLVVSHPRTHALAFIAAAARLPELAELRLERPDGARTCEVCGGTGQATASTPWRIDVPGLTALCGECTGRGWKRNPLLEHDNPLQALFTRAWTDDDLIPECDDDEQDARFPDGGGLLASSGLGLPASVVTAVYSGRSTARHLCWTCQLTVPEVAVTLGTCQCGFEGGSMAVSPLAAVFLAAARDAAYRKLLLRNPGTALARLGLDLALNVVVRCTAARGRRGSPVCPTCGGTRSACELTLCAASHACCCADHDLWDVARSWG